MPVYISGSYWKIFKGNVYQNYYDKFRAQTKVSLLIFDSDGWVDCWTTSNVAISIGYNYHPMPVLLQQAPADEESLTAPLRPSKYLHLQPQDNFDPGEMDSDLIAVELEVAPSMLCVYGSLLRNFLHVKVHCSSFGFHTVSINIQVNNQDININGLYCIQNTDIRIEVNGKLLRKHQKF